MQPEYTFKILEKLLALDIRMTLRRVIRPIIQQMTALCYYEGFVRYAEGRMLREFAHQLALPWGTMILPALNWLEKM